MDDLISRQAAIDAIGKASDELYENIKKGATFPQRQWFDGMAQAQSILENLPSAQSERKGYWIEMGTNKDGTHSIRCSKCGEGYKARGYAWSIATKAKYKFCPNCGADMRDEQEK